MTGAPSEPDLRDQLARWVAEGLINSEQASRIEATEAARAESAPTPTSAHGGRQADGGRPAAPPLAAAEAGDAGSRVPLIVEALGYLGGAMAIIAGFIAVTQLWPDIPAGAEAAFAAVASVLLGIVGAVVRTDGHPALERLESVLWLMSTACLGAFAGVLGTRIWHFSASSAALSVAAVTTVYAVVLWLQTRALLQHLAMFAGAAMTLGAGIARLDQDMPIWGSGLGVWVLSAVWGGAVYRGHIRPRTAGYLAAAVGLLVGAQMMMDIAAGHVVALTTVATLLAGGVVLRRVWLLAIGAYSVIQVVPQTAERYLPNSLAAPLAIFTAGLVLLGVALLLAQWGKFPKSG